MNQLNCAMLLFTLTLGYAWAAGFEGNSNTTLGQGAGNVGRDGNDSVFIGRSAGLSNTSGYGNTFLGSAAGYYNTTGNSNTFLGYTAGSSTTTGETNTFVGSNAGSRNTTGGNNNFLGERAGFSNTTGYNNLFVGNRAGQYNTTGYRNIFLGQNTGGSNRTGRANIFIGDEAGYNNSAGVGNIFIGHEAGSLAGYLIPDTNNTLYIANSDTLTPLIHGEFDNQRLTINGNLKVIGPGFGLVEISDSNVQFGTKAARLVLTHYTKTQLPVYLLGAVSASNQNYIAVGGGNAIGNAATQIDFWTAPNTTTAAGFARMTITNNGNIGMGTQTPLYPLHMASGALVTSGGVWSNAAKVMVASL